MLLALLDQRDAEIDGQLARLGVRPAYVLAELRKHVGAGDDRLWDGILVTPRVRQIIRLAESAAGEALVEPVHLFDAICAEGRSAAAEIVAQAGRSKRRRARVGS